MAADLLGNGTACLVWSSPLPGDARRPMRYVDLMGGQKPHLLVKIDQQPRRRDRGRLRALDQVLPAGQARRQALDHAAAVPGARGRAGRDRTTDKSARQPLRPPRYAYHHGYFDGVEREFRGFGRVEQVDVEDFGDVRRRQRRPAPTSPTTRRSTSRRSRRSPGSHRRVSSTGERILHQFAARVLPELVRRPAARPTQVLGDFHEKPLPEPDLDAQSLTADEWREALRACKGMTLRQEVYELDVDALRDRPAEAGAGCSPPPRTTATSAGCSRAAATATRSSSSPRARRSPTTTSWTCAPRRCTPDPRIAHTLNLQRSTSTATSSSRSPSATRGGRPAAERPASGDRGRGADRRPCRASCTSPTPRPATPTDVGRPITDSYRLRLPCEVQTYELTGVRPADAGDGRYFTLDELRELKLSDRYQAERDGGRGNPLSRAARPARRSRRRSGWSSTTRTLFFDDATRTEPLPLGTLGRPRPAVRDLQAGADRRAADGRLRRPG